MKITQPASVTGANQTLRTLHNTAAHSNPTESYSPGPTHEPIPDFRTYQNAARGQSKVARFMQDPRAKAILSKFPASFQNQVSVLSDAQFKVLHNGTQGETKFGPVKISNKKAFIKGSVFGKSVWPTVHQQMDDAHKKYGMINAAEARHLHGVVDSVSGFSKNQRAQLVQLLEMAARAK